MHACIVVRISKFICINLRFSLYIFDTSSIHTSTKQNTHTYMYIQMYSIHTNTYKFTHTNLHAKVTMWWTLCIRAPRCVQTLRYRLVKLDYRSHYQVPKKAYQDIVICYQHHCDKNVYISFRLVRCIFLVGVKWCDNLL